MSGFVSRRWRDHRGAKTQKTFILPHVSSEIYVAAKETVALAEQQFLSNSHEWQFDNAWQEMLNHATIKVITALRAVCSVAQRDYMRAIFASHLRRQVRPM